MKKMTEQLETLLNQMGFKKLKAKKGCKKNYIKEYGKIASIHVYELFDKCLDEEDQYNTFWDVNVNGSDCSEGEMLTSIDLKGKTIKEHKLAMVELFSDLEIINQIFESK